MKADLITDFLCSLRGEIFSTSKIVINISFPDFPRVSQIFLGNSRHDKWENHNETPRGVIKMCFVVMRDDLIIEFIFHRGMKSSVATKNRDQHFVRRLFNIFLDFPRPRCDEQRNNP